MADTPLINGHRFSWSSIEFHVAGNRNPTVQELTYSTKMEPGTVRGEGMRIISDTRGEAECEGSITMLKSEAQAFFKSQGAGFMGKRFTVTVAMKEDGEDAPLTDTLEGVRIKSIEDSPKLGTEPLKVKLDLHIMRVKYDGLDPVGD